MNMHVLPFVPYRTTCLGSGVGLTDAECFAIARATACLPGSWCVQRDEDDQEHASISLVPNDGGTDDETPVFLLWREDGLLRLGYGQGEFYAGLGIHADANTLMEAVRRHLEGAAAFERWIRARNEL